MRKTGILIFTWFSLLAVVSAQETLTLEEALRTAVANNYAVIIAKNDQEASKYARNIGNAGMLPTVDINGGVTFSNINLNQELSSGTTTQQNAVRNNLYNAGVQLDWILFDGLRMFATYGRLTQLKEQGILNTRVQIEITISQVINSYFDVVRNQQILRSLQESLEVSEERVKIADKKLQVGSGSKTELLQAKIDRNVLNSQVIDQLTLVYDSKTILNQLMVRDPETEFSVTDSIPLGNVQNLASIRKEAVDKNNTLLFEEKNIAIQKYTRREINAGRFPTLALNLSYNFNHQQNQAGFLLLNQQYGFNGGFTLSYRIFDSWRLNTAYKIATINYKNAEERYNNLKLQTDVAILRAYKRYDLALQQAEIEKESVTMAEENVNLSLERFKQGLSNSLELREAQQSYVETVTRWMNALYTAKTQEVELMRLQGNLVK